MAANEMAWFDFFPRWCDCPALVDGVLAARVEVTPTRRCRWISYLALEDDEPFVEPRDTRKLD